MKREFVLLSTIIMMGCAGRMDRVSPPQTFRKAPLDIQGHRGARGLLPENSLVGFEKALKWGVNTLELDLQVTQDGVLIVDHDPAPNADRCSMRNGESVPEKDFKNLTFEEVSKIRCGIKSHPRFPFQKQAKGEPIPRLVDVIELANKHSENVRFNIEMKVKSIDRAVPIALFAKYVVDTIKQEKIEGRTIVQSFYPPALLEVTKLDPTIPTAILVEKRKDFKEALEDSRAKILSPYFKELKKEDISQYQIRGIQIIPWTVNQTNEMRKLIRWGVDGIITDYPNRLIAVWEEERANP